MPNYYVDGTIVSATGTGSGTQADPWGKTDDLIHYAVSQIEAGPGKGSKGDQIFIVAGNVNSTQSPWIQQSTTSNYYNFDRPLGIIGLGRELTSWDGGGNPKIGWNYNEGQPRLDAIVFANITFTNLPTANGNTNHLWGGSSYAAFHDCDILFDPALNGVMTAMNRGFSLINCRYTPSQDLQAYTSNAQCIGTYFNCRNSPSSHMFYGGTFFDCFFDMKDLGRNTTVYGLLQVNARVINCTFDWRGNNSFTCARIDGQEGSFWYNNYIHGDGGSGNKFMTSAYTASALAGAYGNVGYGLTLIHGGNNTPVSNPNSNYLYDTQNEILSESGVVDADNGDWRPSNVLIDAAKFNRGMRDDYVTQRRTPGCFTAQNLIGNPYHPRVRG